MSRSSRTATVVRVREIQSRAAEVESVQRRIESARRQADVDRSIGHLDERATTGERPVNAAALIMRADYLQAGAADVELRRDLKVAADEAAARAQGELIAAHRRQDAVERLFNRHVASEAVEAERVARVELDDVVSARYGARKKEIAQ